MTAILSLFDAHKRLLDTATKDDEAPTPGYMYNEINKITFESYDQSIKVLEHLLLRLKKNNSAAVKLKVLIVMKSIIQKGNPQFRRELQRKSEEIRECLYFKGPPDPLRGDTPYKVVRDQAQVVLNMLFDTETNETISTASMGSNAGPSDPTGSKLPSISSNNFPTSNPSSNGAHFGGIYRGPTSMGNVMYEKKEPTMLEKMKAGIVNLTTRKQPVPEHTAPISTYGKIANLAEPNFREYTGPIEPNKPLGGWHDPNEVRVQANINSPLPRTQTTASEHVEEPQTSTGDKERRLVEELTQPTGVRAVPSTAELNQFVRSCQQGSLDLFAVCDALTDKLTSNRWQARLKALHAIEVLLKNDVDNAVPYFAEHVSALQEQLTSLQKSVADKAQQILALIQPSVAHPQDESAFNFINDDGANGSSSIFDGLNTEEDTSSTLFSGLSLSESAAQPESHTRSHGVDLIDFSETPGPRAAVSAPTSPAPPRNVDLDLLNIDFNARPATAPAPLVQTVPVQYVQYGQTMVPLVSPSMPVYAPLSVNAVPANQLPAMQVAPSPFAAAPYEQPQLPVLNANMYSGPSVYNTQAAKKKSGQSEGFGFVHSAADDDFDFVTTEIQAMKAKTPTK